MIDQNPLRIKFLILNFCILWHACMHIRTFQNFAVFIFIYGVSIRKFVPFKNFPLYGTPAVQIPSQGFIQRWHPQPKFPLQKYWLSNKPCTNFPCTNFLVLTSLPNDISYNDISSYLKLLKHCNPHIFKMKPSRKKCMLPYSYDATCKHFATSNGKGSLNIPSMQPHKGPAQKYGFSIIHVF